MPTLIGWQSDRVLTPSLCWARGGRGRQARYHEGFNGQHTRTGRLSVGRSEELRAAARPAEVRNGSAAASTARPLADLRGARRRVERAAGDVCPPWESGPAQLCWLLQQSTQ